jgi:hypothetical protein
LGSLGANIEVVEAPDFVSRTDFASDFAPDFVSFFASFSSRVTRKQPSMARSKPTGRKTSKGKLPFRAMKKSELYPGTSGYNALFENE